MALENPDTWETIPAAAFDAAMAPYRLPPGARIAVAVSGGADSMALVLLLSSWAASRDIFLHALTVDHCLRDNAAVEAAQVEEWLAARKVPHSILRWEGGVQVREVASSPQDAARNARYDLMTEWCADNDCSHLFVAHHADDQVETFLMRLARGSGVDGLAAMAPGSTRGGLTMARPLLGFAKTQLIGVCRANGQRWLEDPSNEDAASTRVRFRQAQELLEREGFTRPRLLMTVRHLQRAKVALDHAVTAFLGRACTFDGCGVVRASVASLVETPEEVGLRSLSRVLTIVGGSTYGPRFERLEGLYQRAVRGPWRDATLHGCMVVRDGSDLVFCREAAKIAADQHISMNKAVIWDGRFRMSLGPVGGLRANGSFILSPLTRAVWRTLREENASSPLEGMWPRVRETLPVFFDSSGLAAVPHAAFVRPNLKDHVRPRAELTSVFRSSLPNRGVTTKMVHSE